MGKTDLVIRAATSRDAQAISPLIADLGYPATPAETTARLDRVLGTPGHRVLVAESHDKKIIGWVHVFGAVRVESDPFAELGGLVVAKKFRGCGAGTRLVNAAGTWASVNGFSKLRIRSRTERSGAHAFFESLGFAFFKNQKIFERPTKENS
jgi:GNAT superfamily N-acetyltransferase